MILTGPEISKEVANGSIVIVPFHDGQLNPNSYNYRLGHQLTYREDNGKYTTIDLPENGFVLTPHRTYLGHTLWTAQTFIDNLEP